MQQNKIAPANNVASFLIESLLWNVPNEGFSADEYTANVHMPLHIPVMRLALTINARNGVR